MRRLALLATTAVVLGGCGETVTLPEATDRWKPLPRSKLSRTEVGAARIGRAIYVVGGFEQASGGKTTAAVERYGIGSRRWTRVRSMPVALNHAAAASWRGRLYVVGGYSAPNGLANEQALLLRYDPARNRWKRLAEPPSARAALAAAVVGDRLYAVGGARGGAALPTLEIYDLRANRWSGGPDMAVAREHLAAAATGGFVYALAGRAGGQGNFATAERFDTRTRTWERLPDMAKPRGGIAAAAVRGDVVVFGGEEDAGTIREAERLDTATRTWSALPPMRTPRHGLGGAGLDGRVYSIEGGPQPGLYFSTDLEVLDVP
ncbi:MAG TPA: kelch repeat-containing protein [Thermoleophilaceae bacterium]|jgi:non-specific serine/threonine protein kinase